MKVAKLCLALMLGVGLIFIPLVNLYADETSEAILNILIKKGIVTEQEVNQMKAEIKKRTPEVPEGMEERITKLEQEAKKTPKIANFLNGDMKIGGYAQTRYTVGPGKKTVDTLDVNNVKITVSGHVVPEVAYKVEIGPHQSSNILYDAFVRAEYFPKARITIGQFKVPYLEEFITSSSKLKTADRSLATALAQEYSQGLMLDGDIIDNLYYAIAGITGQSRSPTSSDNEAKEVMGRLVYKPFENSYNELLKGLQVGAAIQHGRQARSGNTEGDRFRKLAMLKYTYDGLSLQSEYVRQRQDQIPGVNDVKGEGWYALAAYKFPVKFFELKTKLEPVVKIEQYDPDINVSRDRQDMLTLGLTWYLNKYFYIMGNYQFRDEQTETSNNRFILQSQVKF